jgi:hypothetical protein
VIGVVPIRSDNHDPQALATNQVLQNAAASHSDAYNSSSCASYAANALRSSRSASESHTRYAANAAASSYSTNAALTVEDIVAPGVRSTCAVSI